MGRVLATSAATEPLARLIVRQFVRRRLAAKREVEVPMITVGDVIREHRLE